MPANIPATETNALSLHPDDNVRVAKRTIKAGRELVVGEERFAVNQTIPAGHKVAARSVASGERIIKYGRTIGFATTDIAPGDHVHTHNLEGGAFGRDYAPCSNIPSVEFYGPELARTFPGFLRGDGRVGTRNYLAVISSVNCSASVSRYVAERFPAADLQRRFPNVDGVVAFTHKAGCAGDPGEPTRLLQRVLAGMARHPNVGGYLLIGLGCETNQVRDLIRNEGLADDSTIAMNIQSLGGIRKTVDAAARAVETMLPRVNAATRTPQPLSKLVLAMNCGGSDGSSGFTANPALGLASDELIRHGAASVLAETPEIYGAEQLLLERAINRDVADQLLGFVRWWEAYAERHGVSIDNNPSHGNYEGGLTTIYEKSLGAIAKAGQSPLAAVYAYAEPIVRAGLGFMDTPGFDPVSMTGLVAGGANVGVFTTGRGSVYGCKPTPCIKVATNTPMFEWMEDDMDLNAGIILDGTETLAEVGRRIFEKIVAVAGGEKTKSELAGVGEDEFAPWQPGPVL